MTQKTILIVEDDFLIAKDLQQTLEASGWQIVGPAASVKAALKLLETETPLVAVLDVNLGRQLVTPVAHRLKAIGIPFLLTSGYDEPATLDTAVFGGVEHIVKPFNAQTLLDALSRVSGH